MNSKEALDNIAVEFDTMGMICSNIAYKDFWEKDLHFKEIFGCEYEIIAKDLNRLEQLEKKYQKLEEIFIKRAELCSEFAEYLRQDEKVFDFLIDKFKLELKGNRLYFLHNNQYFELDKEQEKLMKEAFGYE